MTDNPFAHVNGLTQVDLVNFQRSLHTTSIRERIAYLNRTPYLPLPDLFLLLSEGPSPTLVRQLFPQPYAAHLRIFPRAQVDGTGTDGAAYWRWQQLAAYIGQPFPTTVSVRQFLERAHHELLALGIRVEPYIGQLDSLTAHALGDVLRRVVPASVQSYFFVRGHSGLGPHPMYVYRGPANLIEHLHAGQPPLRETPTMWWAEDQSWCVTTPQDSPTAYLGGSEEIVQAVLADQRMEAHHVAGTDIVDDWLAK